MRPIYVIQKIGTGEVYDFFDFTWNPLVEDCIAPYTTKDNTGTIKAYVISIGGEFVQIGWL